MYEEDKKNIIVDEVPEPSSSISLEIFIFIHKIYIYIYNIILLFLFIFKRHAFVYDYKPMIIEVLVAIILLLINIFRLRLTSIGNKTERALILLIGVIMGVINLIGYICLMRLQSYVTYFDIAFGSIELVIIFFELFFSIWTMFNIKVHEKNI